MTSTIPARPTVYKGIAMRSRAEARYAWWLDHCIELKHWEYEPRGYAGNGGQYLPDFVYPSPHLVGHTTYVDVKPPTADTGEALDRMHVILESDPNAILHVAVDRAAYPDIPMFYPAAAWCTPKAGCGRCTR